MNLELLDVLVKKRKPSQQISEWMMFLGICDMYLKKHKIENPIVVELGIGRNKQKRYWEQLFEAEHIGIDISPGKFIPDIVGDTHDPKTLKILKKKLGGRLINILFIDASHSYEGVKKDFEIYSPLCSDIITLHDIETERYQKHKKREVWKFWDELKEKSYIKRGRFENFLFISMHQYHADMIRMDRGIGMIIKK